MKAPFNFWVPMALLAWAGVLWLDPAPFVSPVPSRVTAPAWATDPPPLDGVEFVYGLNNSRCIGCRKCVHACVAENNPSRALEIQYIHVLEMEKGSIDLETANHHYDPPQVPRPDK